MHMEGDVNLTYDIGFATHLSIRPQHPRVISKKQHQLSKYAFHDGHNELWYLFHPCTEMLDKLPKLVALSLIHI